MNKYEFTLGKDGEADSETSYETLLQAIGLKPVETKFERVEIKCWNCRAGIVGMKSPSHGTFCIKCGAKQI